MHCAPQASRMTSHFGVAGLLAEVGKFHDFVAFDVEKLNNFARGVNSRCSKKTKNAYRCSPLDMPLSNIENVQKQAKAPHPSESKFSKSCQFCTVQDSEGCGDCKIKRHIQWRTPVHCLIWLQAETYQTLVRPRRLWHVAPILRQRVKSFAVVPPRAPLICEERTTPLHPSFGWAIRRVHLKPAHERRQKQFFSRPKLILRRYQNVHQLGNMLASAAEMKKPRSRNITFACQSLSAFFWASKSSILHINTYTLPLGWLNKQ